MTALRNAASFNIKAMCHGINVYPVQTINQRFFSIASVKCIEWGFSEYRSFKTDFDWFLISHRNDVSGIYHFSINFIAFLLTSAIHRYFHLIDFNQLLKQEPLHFTFFQRYNFSIMSFDRNQITILSSLLIYSGD